MARPYPARPRPRAAVADRVATVAYPLCQSLMKWKKKPRMTRMTRMAQSKVPWCAIRAIRVIRVIRGFSLAR